MIVLKIRINLLYPMEAPDPRVHGVRFASRLTAVRMQMGGLKKIWPLSVTIRCCGDPGPPTIPASMIPHGKPLKCLAFPLVAVSC
jgi:hypothetical protein